MGTTSVRPGNARMSTPDAPGGLAIVQDLLNTVEGARAGERPDLIGDTTGAQEWSDAVLAEHGWRSQPVDDAGAAELRELREAIRAVLHHESGAGQATSQINGRVDLVLRESGSVELDPPEGAGSIVGLVLAEVMLAQERGDWPRLKLCALRPCDAAFFDRTRNGSARYHLTYCSNHVNLRNSRERKRASNS